MNVLKPKYLHLYSLFKDIYRNLLILILAFAVGVLACFGFLKLLYHPQYRSDLTFSVIAMDKQGHRLPDLQDIIDSEDSIFGQTYLHQLYRSKTGHELNGKLFFTRLDKTDMFKITVISSHPVTAFQAITDMYSYFQQACSETFDDVFFQTVRQAQLATHPLNLFIGYYPCVLAGLLCFLAALMAVVLLSYHRNTLKCPADIDKLPQTTLLTTIPFQKASDRQRAKDREALSISNPALPESFRQSYELVGAKLDFFRKKTGHHMILVTSVNKGEGKTTFAVNLARTLAQNGERVLLIDADLRRPCVWRHFFSQPSDIPHQNYGLFLNGSAPLSQIGLYDKKSGLYLYVNRKSFRQSSEVILSERFRLLLESGEENFDYVIVDSPPAGLTADSETLSGLVPLSILVVKQDRVNLTAVNDTIEAIRRSGNTLLGVVLNQAHGIKDPLAHLHR